MIRNTSVSFVLAMAFLSGFAQAPPSVQQKADHSNCANISATGNVNCQVVVDPEERQKRIDLTRRTEALASEVLDFFYAREGPINSWKQQALAASFQDAFRGNQGGAQQFQQRLQAWNEQTLSIFLSQYWVPQVVPLLNELTASGVDTFPVTSAAATGDPRRVGFMLSVLAERIGKKPPFPRELTPLEAAAIVRGTGGFKMEIYAYTNDPNSVKIAETLRKAFGKSWSVEKAVLPLEATGPVQHGIHIIFPSADLTINFEGMILALEECEFDSTEDVRVAKQPPTILKIEVWPEKEKQPDFPFNQLMPRR